MIKKQKQKKHLSLQIMLQQFCCCVENHTLHNIFHQHGWLMVLFQLAYMQGGNLHEGNTKMKEGESDRTRLFRTGKLSDQPTQDEELVPQSFCCSDVVWVWSLKTVLCKLCGSTNSNGTNFTICRRMKSKVFGECWRYMAIFLQKTVYVLKILVWISSISIYISINTVLTTSLLGLE